MREARAILTEHDPELIVEGEMRGDAALSQGRSRRRVPGFAAAERTPTC